MKAILRDKYVIEEEISILASSMRSFVVAQHEYRRKSIGAFSDRFIVVDSRTSLLKDVPLYLSYGR